MTNAKPSQNGTHKGKSNDNSDRNTNPSVSVHTIQSVNSLYEGRKREIYTRLIPKELLEKFDLDSSLMDEEGSDLLELNCKPGSSVGEMKLFHQAGFQDPILYGQITDTLNAQIHVLLYILNDPQSERFNVDQMPDGSPTRFGILKRNLEAERAAMMYGLAPGQIRRGLRMLGEAIQSFDHFVTSLGHDLYFIEPLYYHNAVIFERYGFRYAKGQRLMKRIQEGFAPGGDLSQKLDGSSPFRMPQAAGSIRLRSWAIHDNLLGEPFTNVTMYQQIGKPAEINTCQDCTW